MFLATEAGMGQWWGVGPNGSDSGHRCPVCSRRVCAELYSAGCGYGARCGSLSKRLASWKGCCRWLMTEL